MSPNADVALADAFLGDSVSHGSEAVTPNRARCRDVAGDAQLRTPDQFKNGIAQ